jgi:hypothetical protein
MTSPMNALPTTAAFASQAAGLPAPGQPVAASAGTSSPMLKSGEFPVATKPAYARGPQPAASSRVARGAPSDTPAALTADVFKKAAHALFQSDRSAPHDAARQLVGAQTRSDLHGLTGMDVDPGRTFIQHFGEDDPEYAALGFQPKGPVSGTQTPTSVPKTLTQAVMDNDPWLDDRVSGGETVIFTDPTGTGMYLPENRLNIDPGVLPSIARHRDFGKIYEKQVTTFWSGNFQQIRDNNESRYIIAATAQYGTGNLTRGDMAMIMDASEQERPAHLAVTQFDINGYPSTDIVQIKHKDSGKIILYVPSENGSSFHAFPGEAAMREWVGQQAGEAETRNALASHFSLYSRRDGNFFTGVDNTLEKIGTRDWAKTNINMKEAPFKGDIFDEVTENEFKADLSDGQESIKSNQLLAQQAEAKKLSWLSLPLGPLGMALTPSLIASNIDLSVRGHTPEERGDALAAAGMDTFFTALGTLPTSWTSKVVGSINQLARSAVKNAASAIT